MGLLTLRSPVVLHNLIFRVELVPLMSRYGHKWETGFDWIHLQIILVHHWSISIFIENSYKLEVSGLHMWGPEATEHLDCQQRKCHSASSCQVSGTELHCSHLSTRPPPVLCVHPLLHPRATLTHTPSVHTLITRGSCNKIPSLYPPILPYLTSFKNASILHAFSFPFKFQFTGI